MQAETGDDAPDFREPATNVPVVFRFEVSADVAERVAKAIAAIRMAAPEGAGELSEEDVLAQMAEAVLTESGPEKLVPTERFQQVIRVCPTCDSAHLAGTATGEPIVASEEVRAMAQCDSEVIHLEPGADGQLNRTVSPKVKRKVLDRDDYRCSVPGCNNRYFLDLHHVVHRENHGPNTVENLTTTCSCCHRWIHKGHLHIESDTNGGFSFNWTADAR